MLDMDTSSSLALDCARHCERHINMTAGSQVFDLPELVRAILDQVYEQASSDQLHSNDRLKLQPLVPLLLVNKIFYHCGTDIIWRSAPHSALLNIQPPQRQIYADKIRQLSINQIDDTFICEHVRFPRLARLSCCVYAGDAPHGLEHYVSAYLQESLEHLTIIPQAYSLEDDRGPHGPQVPHNLAGLQLSGPPGMQGFPPFTPVALQLPQGSQLPPGMPNLLPLPNLMGLPRVVGPGMHPDMSGPLIPNSGWQLPPRSFKVDNQLDGQLLDKIPFPSLRVLDMHLDRSSISLLLDNVTTLQELSLTDVSPNAFATIGKPKGLTKLTLTVDEQESATLTDHHFSELQSLCILRKLSVTSVESYVHGIQDFNQIWRQDSHDFKNWNF